MYKKKIVNVGLKIKMYKYYFVTIYKLYQDMLKIN